VRLPELPNSLVYLSCNNNVLSELPELPSELQQLLCDENMLKTLPTLPKVDLIAISCSKNEITSLPELPNTLQELNCEFNKLKTLPKLPKSLVDLGCTYNNLTSVYQEICENISDDLADGNEDHRELVLNRINKLMNNHPKHQNELKKYINSAKVSKFIENERGTNTNRGILEYLNSNNLRNFNTNSLKPSNVQRKVLKNRGYTRKNHPTKPGRYRLKKL
jgi:predicted transcriptional regulator